MKRSLFVLASLAALVLSAASASALNPQPLPPKYAKFDSASRFDRVLLNPQPLPPRYKLLYVR